MSTGLAALGGAMLASAQRSFDASTFDPIQSLIWFAAVMVFGIDSATGAVLGAALLVTLDSIFGSGRLDRWSSGCRPYCSDGCRAGWAYLARRLTAGAIDLLLRGPTDEHPSARRSSCHRPVAPSPRGCGDDGDDGPTLYGDGVVRRHGGLVAVDHVDVTVAPGRVLGLIGPNGAGKSTLLDCLAGTQPLDGGRVRLGDHDITRASPDERSRRGLVRTFQRSSVFGSLTVDENLRIGAENRHRRGLVRGILGHATRSAGRPMRSCPPCSISWACAPLAARPHGRPADRHPPHGRAGAGPVQSPVGPPARRAGQRPRRDRDRSAPRSCCLSLRGSGLGIALVEHDLDLVGEVADDLVVMVTGQVLAEGPPAEVLARPDVRLAITGASR